MGTTPGGLPYPEPTDPVAAGADAIKALAQAVEPERVPVWTPITPPANWQNLTGGYTPAGYSLTGSVVRVRGHLQYIGATALTGASTVLVLPAEARPTVNHDYVTWLAGGSAATALRMLINTVGNVNVYFSSTAQATTNAWITLDGILLYRN